MLCDCPRDKSASVEPMEDKTVHSVIEVSGTATFRLVKRRQLRIATSKVVGHHEDEPRKSRSGDHY